MAPGPGPPLVLVLIFSSIYIQRVSGVDDSTLEGYGFSIIHEEMLKDSNRTDAYRHFIVENSAYFKDKIVADLGCGLGLMSLLSAQVGAKKVYCIEGSGIANAARSIVSKNGMEGVVEVIQGRIEETHIPEGYVDIIISEWMGYFLLLEDILPDVVAFRDRYLTQNGIIAPSRARLWGALYSDDLWYSSRVEYWKDVYGFDYSSLSDKIEAFDGPERQHLRPEGIISKPSKLVDLNLYDTSAEDLGHLKASIRSHMRRNATVHGFGVWFDALLQGPHAEVWLDTSPAKGYTSWSQSVWYFRDPTAATKSSRIKGSFNMRRNSNGDFDISLKLREPFEKHVKTYGLTAMYLYQDLYERLEFEHGVYENYQLRRNLERIGMVVATILCFVLGAVFGSMDKLS